MIRPRLILSVLALAGLTAFAPAPLPRRGGRGADNGVSLSRLQGTWRIVRLQSTTASGLVDLGDSLHEVRIENGRWSFLYNNQNPPVVYDLAVDGRRQPATLDLMRLGQKEPYGKGLITRQGDDVKVLYGWSTERPRGFLPLPAGYVLLTLRKQR